jgi:membrane-bound lytic murein transglycosylase D
MHFLKLMMVVALLCANALVTPAQSPQLYNDMSRAERRAFVADQARRIAREISGTEYQFTAAFEEDIKNAVTQYAQRVGNPNADLQLVFQRGQVQAPLISATFRTRNVSPLIGLYIPWIESEYQNIQPTDPNAAVGIYQFMPKTGQRFGLSTQDLLDVSKSADAAAQYIIASMEKLKEAPMKEALAILAYNRGIQNTMRDLEFLDGHKSQCSICTITADRSKRDETFSYENVLYVPRFFAAAIVGENPKVFGVKMPALSTY